MNETVMVRWNGRTRKHYEKKGYVWTKQNDFFVCKAKDLTPSSEVIVKVKCDYCGDIVDKKFKDYTSSRKDSPVQKDACNSCKHQK